MSTLVHPDGPRVLTDAQKRRRSAEAKGKRLQQLVATWLGSKGWWVEPARKAVVWIFDPVTGRRQPRQIKHDLFGAWDGIAIKGPRRQFYQVTTLPNVAAKRSKIAACGFPATLTDRIYGYIGRPGLFRVLAGPDFEMPGEEIVCKSPVVKKP
jgi:hypothetical protein